VNGLELEKTAASLADRSRVHTRILDVASCDAWAAYASEVEGAFGPAQVVINNAGIALRAAFEELSLDQFELVMGVNFWGVVYGCKAFLPHFRKRGEGHVVNISSINGMVPFAQQAPYNCSKYAVLGLSETLMQELHGSGIQVTVVHPGGIRTNIVRNSTGRGLTEKDAKQFDRIARTSSESAAAQILDGVERNRERVYVGADAKLMSASKRLAPALTVRVVGAAATAFAKKRP
jgi:short-subunit dehydrogenase